MGAISLLKVGAALDVGGAAPRVIASAAKLNKITEKCFIMRYLYFTGLIAQPNALVRELVTGLPASTASRASRRSNLVGSARRMLKSSTRLSMRPRYSSVPSLDNTAASGMAAAP